MTYSAEDIREMMKSSIDKIDVDKTDNYDAELEAERYMKSKSLETENNEIFNNHNDYDDISVDLKKDSMYTDSVTTTPITRKVVEKSDKAETCFLKNIPKCLVDMVRTCFPDNVPNYLAVSAFLYANRCDRSIDYSDVPDNVKQFAKIYEQKNREMRTSNDIKKINENISRLNKVNDDLVLALSYLIYDSNGFRKNEPKHPSEIDFYDPGIQQVTKKLEETSDKLRREYEYEQGKRKGMYGQKG